MKYNSYDCPARDRRLRVIRMLNCAGLVRNLCGNLLRTHTRGMLDVSNNHFGQMPLRAYRVDRKQRKGMTCPENRFV